jgi:hypothetical protein
MAMNYHFDSLPTTRLIKPVSDAARQTAGTRRISAAYTGSVRVLRAAVRANWEAGHGRIKDERADDTSLEIIDTVVALDPAARRTLRLVAGQLKRACAGPRPRRGRAMGNGPSPNGPFAHSARYGIGRNGD